MKDILAVVRFPKATYMYWQKRFDRVDPNKELEDKIIEIHEEHKDFGYRRMHAILRKQGFLVNKREYKGLCKNLDSVLPLYTKSRRYNSYKGKVGKIAPNRINRRFHTSIPHQKITTDTTEFKYYEIDEKVEW